MIILMWLTGIFALISAAIYVRNKRNRPQCGDDWIGLVAFVLSVCTTLLFGLGTIIAWIW